MDKINNLLDKQNVKEETMFNQIKDLNQSLNK